MKAAELVKRGYRWSATPHQWWLYLNNKLVAEGFPDHSNVLNRRVRKQLNKIEARKFAKVDFVKRRVSESP